jgi:hypothetical protein
MILRKVSLFMLGVLLLAGLNRARANPEAADRAWEMIDKYRGIAFYVNPLYEGHAGYATTLEFTIKVAQGLDYVFVLAGDRYCQDVNVWIESEEGNTVVKDTRKTGAGLCGVRWRADYSGTVTVIVHFARVSSRCGWAALIGRRGTLRHDLPDDAGVSPTSGRLDRDRRKGPEGEPKKEK